MARVSTLPKWLNALIAWYQRSQLPGKYRFYQLTAPFMSQMVIRHPIKEGMFAVPWSQWCFWLQNGPNNYYLDEFEPLSDCINQHSGPVSFVDLGADIGIAALTLLQRCNGIEQVIAVEPNPQAFSVLVDNMAQLLPDSHCVCKAVASESGKAELQFDSAGLSDHEGHIRLTEDGTVEAQTLDELVKTHSITLWPTRVIKIDVEGQELGVFQGGQRTVAEAEKVILFLEIHPDVLARSSQTPEMLFNAAEDIRPFRWRVPRQGNRGVDRKQDFFEQFPYQQYDVIGISE